MSYTNRTILGNTVHGVANGTYDGTSLDFVGNVVPAANYYNGLGSFQTVTINVTNFVGTVDLKASLNDPLVGANWFKCANTFGNASSATTGIFPITITGNFVWMEAEIKNFISGNINSITISY